MAIDKNTTITVLDHLDNITVPGNVFHEPANEYWALTCWREGMEFLYRQALRCDQTFKQQVNPDDNICFFGGNLSAFGQVPSTLLTCAFQWYSVTACQYVRTVGAIAYRVDQNRPLPQEYVDRVIPEVLAYRDKVGAHTAWATRNSRDNNAERLASILPQPTYTDDSFYVGGLTVGVRKAGKASTSQTIKPWSLCKVHQAFGERYWPDQQGGQDSEEGRNAE